MELRQLRYFVAVAEERHFGRAAQRVHIAQPAVSEQVRKLEAELGLRLLDRGERPVALTPAGAAMLDEARRVLRQAEVAESAARRASARTAGRLRLGYLRDGFPAALPRALQRFRATAPGIDVALESGSPVAMIEDVRARRLDAAVVCLPAPVSGLRTTKLAEVAAVAAVPSAHPHRPVALEHLEGTSVVLAPRAGNPAFYDAMIAAARGAGVSLSLIETAAEGVEHALLAVAAGLGVALLPESAVERHAMAGVRFETLGTPAPTCDVVIASRRHDPSTVTAAWLRAVTATAAQRHPVSAAAAALPTAGGA